MLKNLPSSATNGVGTVPLDPFAGVTVSGPVKSFISNAGTAGSVTESTVNGAVTETPVNEWGGLTFLSQKKRA